MSCATLIETRSFLLDRTVYPIQSKTLNQFMVGVHRRKSRRNRVAVGAGGEKTRNPSIISVSHDCATYVSLQQQERLRVNTKVQQEIERRKRTWLR